MKPNDKAIEAGVKLCWDCPRATPSMIRDILEAAYAAQFPPSEDYAGLVERLKQRGEWTSDKIWESEPDCEEAADAIEAVLAERDALKAENESMKQSLPLWAHKQMAANNEVIERLRSERDALLARLAPVDDEALVEIATREIFIERKSLAAAIAAIRPHIEAAERERCAKIAEEGEDGSCWTASERSIAAAIRSGSGK